jgi:hypothetical protein
MSFGGIGNSMYLERATVGRENILLVPTDSDFLIGIRVFWTWLFGFIEIIVPRPLFQF